MKIDKKDLGRWLLDRRQSAGLTQQESADELGFSTCQSISNWERGVSSPSPMRLKELVRYYEVPVDEFRADMHQFF